MKNMKIDKIEFDIFMWIYNNEEELGSILLETLYKTIIIEREFTGVGAFISFNILDYEKEKLKNIKYESQIIDGPTIVSDEFEHEAPITLFFDKNGILNYFEICFGMKYKNYPEEYTLVQTEFNNIIEL